MKLHPIFLVFRLPNFNKFLSQTISTTDSSSQSLGPVQQPAATKDSPSKVTAEATSSPQKEAPHSHLQPKALKNSQQQTASLSEPQQQSTEKQPTEQVVVVSQEDSSQEQLSKTEQLAEEIVVVSQAQQPSQQPAAPVKEPSREPKTAAQEIIVVPQVQQPLKPSQQLKTTAQEVILIPQPFTQSQQPGIATDIVDSEPTSAQTQPEISNLATEVVVHVPNPQVDSLTQFAVQIEEPPPTKRRKLLPKPTEEHVEIHIPESGMLAFPTPASSKF